MPWTCADPVPEVTTPVWRLTKTLMALKWLPPGDDGSVSPAMAHLKCQGAASSLLSCRAREGLGPERRTGSWPWSSTCPAARSWQPCGLRACVL